ncbi:cytochrome c3 family protein [bacterium]|nr:cytochrome c3 family protein [candidate division CSSED10-310 bacterium]
MNHSVKGLFSIGLFIFFAGAVFAEETPQPTKQPEETMTTKSAPATAEQKPATGPSENHSSSQSNENRAKTFPLPFPIQTSIPKQTHSYTLDVIKFDTPKQQNSNVIFMHSNHIKVYNASCQTCHPAIKNVLNAPENDQKTVHDACKGCHSEGKPAKTFSCQSCHTASQ